MQAELAQSKEAAMNVLAMIRHKEYMRKARKNALRAQHINSSEITGWTMQTRAPFKIT